MGRRQTLQCLAYGGIAGILGQAARPDGESRRGVVQFLLLNPRHLGQGQHALRGVVFAEQTQFEKIHKRPPFLACPQHRLQGCNGGCALVLVARQLPKRRACLSLLRRPVENRAIASHRAHHIAELGLHKLRGLQRERVSHLGTAGPARPRIEYLDQLGVLALAAVDLADELKRLGIVGIDVQDRAQLAGRFRSVMQFLVVKLGRLHIQAAQGHHVVAGLDFPLQHLSQARPVV